MARAAISACSARQDVRHRPLDHSVAGSNQSANESSKSLIWHELCAAARPASEFGTEFANRYRSNPFGHWGAVRTEGIDGMQIKGLSGGFADSGAVGRRNELLAVVSGKGGEPNSQAAGSSNATMDLLTGIVSDYDLSDITPRDFSAMLRELRDAGALTDAEYGDLAQIRLDMDAENLDPDDSVDLLAFCQKTLDRARHDNTSDAGPPPAMTAMQRRIDWLEKVAILQESPDAAGLNALV